MLTLDINRVAELFALFADLEGDGPRQWHGFCGGAARMIASRLRPEAGEEDMEALCIAAAGIAYSDYLALQTSSRGQDGIKVGDISLGGSGGMETAEQRELRDHFLAGIAHLLEPQCPALLAVGTAP